MGCGSCCSGHSLLLHLADVGSEEWKLAPAIFQQLKYGVARGPEKRKSQSSPAVVEQTINWPATKSAKWLGGSLQAQATHSILRYLPGYRWWCPLIKPFFGCSSRLGATWPQVAATDCRWLSHESAGWGLATELGSSALTMTLFCYYFAICRFLDFFRWASALQLKAAFGPSDCHAAAKSIFQQVFLECVCWNEIFICLCQFSVPANEVFINLQRKLTIKINMSNEYAGVVALKYLLTQRKSFQSLINFLGLKRIFFLRT